jgi:hypothetical protein
MTGVRPRWPFAWKEKPFEKGKNGVLTPADIG